jgi:hypothetical protein
MQPTSSRFRVWVTNKWFEHKDEAEAWGSKPCGTPQQYFLKYRWFLKTLYKHQLKQEKTQC